MELGRRGSGVVVKGNRFAAVIPTAPESAPGSGVARFGHNVFDSLVLVK